MSAVSLYENIGGRFYLFTLLVGLVCNGVRQICKEKKRKESVERQIIRNFASVIAMCATPCATNTKQLEVLP